MLCLFCLWRFNFFFATPSSIRSPTTPPPPPFASNHQCPSPQHLTKQLAISCALVEEAAGVGVVDRSKDGLTRPDLTSLYERCALIGGDEARVVHVDLLAVGAPVSEDGTSANGTSSPDGQYDDGDDDDDRQQDGRHDDDDQARAERCRDAWQPNARSS